MTSLRDAIDELPPAGDEAEARRLVSRHSITLPTYKLDKVRLATLNVDYAPPAGDSGYARPLSPYRLNQLREEWDPRAVAPLIVSRRIDGSNWLVDGGHRVQVASEKGLLQLPAMIHSGLAREQEADLYVKLGTVLGQTPWTRFQSKLVAGDNDAHELARIAARYDLEINGAYGYMDGRIAAVARMEWIYARGGKDATNWVLAFLVDAFQGDHASLGADPLEGTFGFWLRYADRVNRGEIARLLGASGFMAWQNRADSVWQRVDIGRRGNTFGAAILEIVNDDWRRRGRKVKDLLPAWERNPNQYTGRFRDVSFGQRAQWRSSSSKLTLTLPGEPDTL